MIYRRLAGMEENIFAKLVYIFAESGNRKNVHFTVRPFSRKIKLEAQLLGSELLERKQEILDAQLHLVGGATC